MWELYDALIEEIPSYIKVEDLRVTADWGFVTTENTCAVGVSYPVESVMTLYNKDWRNCPLKDLAACVKSWNLPEASLGAAAINCYYNSEEMCAKNGIRLGKTNHSEDRLNDPFIAYQRAIRNKKVAVVGHFPYLEKLFDPFCDLKILDDGLLEGDYPLLAADYILPESDYVFITCGSVVQKTLPRFLKLSEHAYTTIVGPATPMAPVLFEFGVQDLSGFIFRDKEMASRIITGGMFISLYTTGNKVHFTQTDSQP
ncbi:MAG: Rossmann-like domain-containing protein [Lachnospiraceae bacterium]